MALQHLALCLPEFEAMGMQPALGRALALRGRLGAVGTAAAVEPGVAAVVVDSPAEPDTPPAPSHTWTPRAVLLDRPSYTRAQFGSITTWPPSRST